MAGFVRVAAEEKAQVLLDREARLTLTDRDFTAFASALDTAFAPDPALKAALTQVRRKVRLDAASSFNPPQRVQLLSDLSP